LHSTVAVGMVAAEAVGFTVVAAGAASMVAVAELDRVSAEAHVPVDQVAFVGVHLVPWVQQGQELTVIDLTVRDLLECTVAGAQLLQVHVTAQCRGTERIQG
jgi:hypothetical protein